MLELVARKSNNPEVLLNLARRYLDCHEWGRARMLLEQMDTRDSPECGVQVETLLQDILRRLDNSQSQENKYEF